MDDKLKKIISDYVSDYMGKSSWNCVVKKSIPVIWFGNIERYKESELKIVTVGINPSLKEFPDLPEKPRFNIPDSLSGNEENLYNILNDYFNNNPYKLWFEQYEKILEGSFNCSYGGKMQNKNDKLKNIAIHIDCCTAIATDPIWGHLEKIDKNKIIRNDLFNSLIEYLEPDVILFSAGEEMFNKFFSNGFILNDKSLQYENYTKRTYIRTYKKGNTTLLWGRNHGIPFAHITIEEINLIIKNFLENGLLNR